MCGKVLDNTVESGRTRAGAFIAFLRTWVKSILSIVNIGLVDVNFSRYRAASEQIPTPGISRPGTVCLPLTDVSTSLIRNGDALTPPQFDRHF